ncbi:MAG TPA: hypothetical protein VKC66_20380 [Xanthobacteraceae bacterium]|nr:hypothetical protein [Xanthobacteraceae bacterium]
MAKPNGQFSAVPGANYSGRAFKTEDNTNHSRDHARSGADYHHFSSVGSGGRFQFRGVRGY